MKFKYGTMSGFFVAAIIGSMLSGQSAVMADPGHDKHGTSDARIVACHEAHEKMMKGGMKMDAAHMKGCHDKDGKLIGNADGHMGKNMKMPMGDHMMGGHKGMDKH